MQRGFGECESSTYGLDGLYCCFEYARSTHQLTNGIIDKLQSPDFFFISFKWIKINCKPGILICLLSIKNKE